MSNDRGQVCGGMNLMTPMVIAVVVGLMVVFDPITVMVGGLATAGAAAGALVTYKTLENHA